MDDIQLFNNDCFNIFPTLEDKSINLFILDLPYGQTACHWDSVIDLDEMWKHIKRIMKPNALIVFFCTAKFGNTLINANPKWFKYDLIWKKSRKVGFLSANKMPLRQHENIYVFKKEQGTYHPQKTEGKPYKSKEHIENAKIYNNGKPMIRTATKDTTNRHPTSIIDHENIYVFNDKPTTHSKKENQEYSTYNPQKTNGKPFKVKGGKSKAINGSLSRGHEVISQEYENKGVRHPTSIIDHENIYVFDNTITDDIELSRNKDLREYAEKVFKFINKPMSKINKDLKTSTIEHFFYIKGVQFKLCLKKYYLKMIELYNIDEMEGFIEYDILKEIWDNNNKVTYNPQKTEGKPYKNGADHNPNNVYGITKEKGTVTKTDRHPTSIIDHENIYVFDNPKNEEYNDLELSRNKDLREYAEKVFKFIGKNRTQIEKKIGNTSFHHFYNKGVQFGLCTNETYNQLIKEYNIDEMEDYLEYEILEVLWEDAPPKIESTYNSQKTEGTPYKTNGGKMVKCVYGSLLTANNVNKGDRHPTSIIPEYEGDSILVYKNPHKTIHRTQKPVELLEWLIKTYSNEGDTVMDFTMGSGTCAVGCINTKRKFIGVEMDKEIYNLAFDRIEKHKKNI